MQSLFRSGARLSRVTGRPLLWLAVFWGLMLANTSPASAVEIRTLLGFGKTPETAVYRLGSFVPLRVYLKNVQESGEGTLQVTTRLNGQTRTYSRPVHLAPNSPETPVRFTLDLKLPEYYRMRDVEGEYVVTRLLMGGRKLAEHRQLLVEGSSEFFVLVVDSASENLKEYVKKINSRSADGENDSYLNQKRHGRNFTSHISSENRVRLIEVAVFDMPVNGQDYGTVEAVIFDRSSKADDSIDRLESRDLSRNLIVELSKALSQFGNEGGNVLTTLFDSTDQKEVQIYRSSGLKSCHLPAKPDATGCKKLLEALTGPNGLHFSPIAAFKDLTEGNGLGGVEVADALAGKQASRTPAFGTVILFLSVYLLLLVPGNYFLLKKINRRELAWVTMPLLIVGFASGAFLIAKSIKSGEMTLHRAVVLEANAGSEEVTGYGQFSIYSPHRNKYDISFAAPNPKVNPYANVVPSEIYSSSASMKKSGLNIEHAATTTLHDTSIALWDKRTFETPVRTSLNGKVDASVTPVRGKPELYRVTITNHTAYSLQNCSLILGNNVLSIGKLASGKTYQEVMAWNSTRQSNPIKLSQFDRTHFAISQAGETYPGEPEDQIRWAMTNTLEQKWDTVFRADTFGPNGEYAYTNAGQRNGKIVHAFIGWFDAPLLDIRVDGKKPAGQEVNMLYVRLPIPLAKQREIEKSRVMKGREQ